MESTVFKKEIQIATNIGKVVNILNHQANEN